MEGISPTLALAALFFGMTGHPHDAVESATQKAEIVAPVELGCGGFLSGTIPGATAGTTIVMPVTVGQSGEELLADDALALATGAGGEDASSIEPAVPAGLEDPLGDFVIGQDDAAADAPTMGLFDPDRCDYAAPAP